MTAASHIRAVEQLWPIRRAGYLWVLMWMSWYFPRREFSHLIQLCMEDIGMIKQHYPTQWDLLLFSLLPYLAQTPVVAKTKVSLHSHSPAVGAHSLCTWTVLTQIRGFPITHPKPFLHLFGWVVPTWPQQGTHNFYTWPIVWVINHYYFILSQIAVTGRWEHIVFFLVPSGPDITHNPSLNL